MSLSGIAAGRGERSSMLGLIFGIAVEVTAVFVAFGFIAGMSVVIGEAVRAPGPVSESAEQDFAQEQNTHCVFEFEPRSLEFRWNEPVPEALHKEADEQENCDASDDAADNP